MPDRLRIALLLAPALAIVAVLFLGALALAFVRSLDYLPAIGLTTPNLGPYADLLASREFALSLLLSLHIAVTSTLISAVLAVGAALLIRRTRTGRGLATFLFQLNLTVPHLVGAAGVLYLFSQSGLVARGAYGLGLIEGPAQFPALVHDRFAVGIILQYVWKEVPFIGIVVLAALRTIGDTQEDAARTLGAGRWQAFRLVLLPQIMPALFGASAIVFAFTFGAYEIPALLGQHHPVALPVLAYRDFTAVDLAARPRAMATAMVIAALGLVLVQLYAMLARRHVR